MNKFRLTIFLIILFLVTVSAGCSKDESSISTSGENQETAGSEESTDNEDSSEKALPRTFTDQELDNMNGSDWNTFILEEKIAFIQKYLDSFDYPFTAEELVEPVDHFYLSDENLSERAFIAVDTVVYELSNSNSLEVKEINEFLGDESFTSMDFYSNTPYGVTKKDDTMVITYELDSNVYRSTLKDGKWIEKDKLVEIPSSWKESGCSQFNIEADYILLRCYSEFRYIDGNGKEGFIELPDDDGYYDEYSIVNLSNGSVGIIYSNKLYLLNGSDPLEINDPYSVFRSNFVATYFDTNKNELYVGFERTKGIKKLNIIDGEPLYDGGEEKMGDTTEDVKHIISNKSGQVIVAANYAHNPSYITALNENLDVISSISLNEPIGLEYKKSVTEDEVQFWLVHEYQNKPALKLISIKVPK